MTTENKMTDEDYALTQQRIILLAGFCRNLRITEFLSRISETETIAPILYPTLYVAGMDKLAQVKQLARSLLPFQEELRRQIEES